MNNQFIDSGDETATPLDPEEAAGLIPSYITTQAQLNEAEQINVATASDWAFRRRRDVLSEKLPILIVTSSFPILTSRVRLPCLIVCVVLPVMV